MCRIVQRTLLLAFVSLSLTIYAAAQQDSGLIKQISDIHPVMKGDKMLSIPVAPLGFRLVLKGSDHNPIIDGTGRIVPPIVDTKVKVYFQLISNKNDSIRYDLSRQITVPGEFSDHGGNAKPFVIPALREWYGGKGNFILSDETRIVFNSTDDKSLQRLSQLLQKEIKGQTGLSLQVVKGRPRKDDIFLSLKEKDTSIGEEGYYFRAGGYISISAIRYRGLFWGTRTLLQLLERGDTISRGVARDYPQFKVRGFVLDDGRKFFRLRFLRDYVQLLSYYKMNDFQIHLNDNGFKKYFGDNWDSTYSAFRLENNTYPGLTAKDGFYTKKDFVALQQLADEYGVQIVPEIDVPAHALAFTKAVPAIGSSRYGRDHLDLHNPLTDTVIQNVFKEYLSGQNPVFTGNIVDIGTDEYAKADAEAFRAFTDKMIRFVQSYGKKVRLWGALTWAKGTTPVTVKNVTMNTWYNGYANPVDMKKLGYDQISTPDGWLYIVPAAGYYYDYLNIAHLYENWTPSIIGDIRFCAGDPAIVGGSFAEWNDIVGNGISEKDVNDRVFPALQVLAQKMWCGDDRSLPYETFAMQSKNIGEGPGLNIRGKLGDSAHSLVATFHFDKREKGIEMTGNAVYTKGVKGNALSFPNAGSIVKLPYEEAGYDYTVSFWINLSEDNGDDVPAFLSENAVLKLKQRNTGQLGFSRDGYDFSFNYRVPVDTWTHIVITGTNKGTALYVDGKLQDSLYNKWIQYDDKEKTRMRKMETLFFPLKNIGGFKGKIDELQIWNKVLDSAAIGAL